MYSVMLVDDEPNVITGLMATIPWAELGFTVSATASSLQEALGQPAGQPVDAVVTDIKMPGGSGLELCRQLRAAFPRMQLILISGHADFSFAREAIAHGVIGYCLKPVQADEMCVALRKAHTNLQRDAGGDFAARMAAALGEESAAGMRAALSAAGLSPERFYMAVTVGGDGSGAAKTATASLPLGRGQAVHFFPDMLSPGQAEEMMTLGKMEGMGILDRPTTPEMIPRDIRRASALAHHYFITGVHQVVYHAGREDAAVYAKFRQAAEQRDTDSLHRLLREMEQRTPDITLRCALRLWNLLMDYTANAPLEDEDDRYMYSFDQLLSLYPDFSAMVQDMGQLLDEPAAPLEGDFESSNLNFLQIVKYIHQHYGESITLRTVAEALHLNAGYVSQLFSRESGTTYKKYLTELRIEKAQELLRTTAHTIGEIADMVGFNDYFHFLKTFKRITGVTPGKYTASPEGVQP